MITKTEGGVMEHTVYSPPRGLIVETRHYWIEILRIFTGGLLFYQGYFFVENISEVYALIEQSMNISAFIIAHYVVGAHLVGGLMLILGMLTRLAAIVQIPILLGAVIFVHGRSAFLGPGADFEYALLMLILLVVFFFYGAGKWSVDHWVIRRKEGTAA
jgi:putative oxidoreductase